MPDAIFKSQSVPTKVMNRETSTERDARVNPWDRVPSSEIRRRSIKDKEQNKSLVGRIAETISSVVRAKSKDQRSGRQGYSQVSNDSNGIDNKQTAEIF